MAFVQRIIMKRYTLLLIIVLIGLFLRVNQLGTPNLTVDEAVSTALAKMNLSQLMQAQPALELNPPL
jgi:hypothetical protein